jgi:UDP-N-acetylmuramoylalanine--D-glutamate ligase
MSALAMTNLDSHLHRPAVVVVGLGATGLSVARHLAALGESVLVMDSREHPPGLDALRRELPQVPALLGPFDAALLAAAGRVILSPGVPLADPAVQAALNAGVEVVGDVELFAREVSAPVAAVTGSNGKSTVTALLADMTRAAQRRTRVGGNFGPPALELLAGEVADVYVLELSSFQLETTWSLAPAVAAVLNVSPDHLDRYPDLAAYVAAKARVLDGAGAAVLNLDDPRVARMGPDAARVAGFSVLGDPRARAGLVRGDGGEWLALGGEPVAPAASMPLAGRHNLANALAAMAMAELLGVPHAAMARGIAGFRGLAHRCVRVAERAGVHWIDDSKGTNVGATVAAIEGIARGRNLVLIAGGLGKGQDFSALAAPIARHVHTLVLLGRDAGAIDAVVPAAVARRHAAAMDDAVALAAQAARAGDTVLLSPACASFDMFDGYAARGLAFAGAVHALGAP